MAWKAFNLLAIGPWVRPHKAPREGEPELDTGPGGGFFLDSPDSGLLGRDGECWPGLLSLKFAF